MHLNGQDIETFQETVWGQYHAKGRHTLPWRVPEADGTFDPYKIMVSEVMLQQTQVSRAITKYAEFLDTFPHVHDLSQAPLGEVLRVWQGLGYNRRAKFLWQAAQLIDSQGGFPKDSSGLIKLPGIGLNTAAAIQVYSFNSPIAFIETNIRTVYIHAFYPDQVEIRDADILALVTQTMDVEHPREWFWALMDYGSSLKATVGNLSRLSKSYTKQSTFHGSTRQIRGHVIRLLIDTDRSAEQLQIDISDARLSSVLDQLLQEGLIQFDGQVYALDTKPNMVQ